MNRIDQIRVQTYQYIKSKNLYLSTRLSLSLQNLEFKEKDFHSSVDFVITFLRLVHFFDDQKENNELLLFSRWYELYEKKDNNSPNAVSKWMNQCILIKVTHTVGVTACDFFFHYFPAALSDGLTFQTRLPLPGSGHTLCSFSSPRCQSHCEPRLQPAASDSRMCLEVYLTFLFDIYVPPR